MPRPSTKTDLIEAANKQFETIWTLIDSIHDDKQNAPFDFGDISAKKETHWARDKNLRDVLIHLYEWHQLLINWISSNQAGVTKPFLPEPYNWRTYPKMNIAFWERHQTTSLDHAKNLVIESHYKVMEMIDTFSNDDLFSKGALPWTGASTLGSYCVSATSSHYDWAIKKIKLHKKTQV